MPNLAHNVGPVEAFLTLPSWRPPDCAGYERDTGSWGRGPVWHLLGCKVGPWVRGDGLCDLKCANQTLWKVSDGGAGRGVVGRKTHPYQSQQGQTTALPDPRGGISLGLSGWFFPPGTVSYQVLTLVSTGDRWDTPQRGSQVSLSAWSFHLPLIALLSLS